MNANVSDLCGPALDWAVASVQGFEIRINNSLYPPGIEIINKELFGNLDFHLYMPSTNHTHAGVIIDREGIVTISCWNDGKRNQGEDSWRAHIPFVNGELSIAETTEYGRTRHEAAMRSFVNSRIGCLIDVPTGLLSY